MKKQRWRFSKKPSLKKGDKVFIHTHAYAERYKGQIFTCDSNEKKYSDDGQRYVWLKELGYNGKTFFVDFLTKIN